MITFKKYLQEKAPITLNMGGTDLSIFENPVKPQIVTAFRKSRRNELRFLVDKDTNKLFVWDSFVLIHDQVFFQLMMHGILPTKSQMSPIKGYIRLYAGDEYGIDVYEPRDKTHQVIQRLQKMLGSEKVNAFFESVEYLEERAPFDLPVRGVPISIFENPSGDQIKQALKKALYSELRYVIDKSNKIWVWDASRSIHAETIEALVSNGFMKDRVSYQDTPMGYIGTRDNYYYIEVYYYEKFIDHRTLKRLAKIIKTDRVFSA